MSPSIIQKAVAFDAMRTLGSDVRFVYWTRDFRAIRDLAKQGKSVVSKAFR